MKIRAVGLTGVAHYTRYFCRDHCRIYFSSCIYVCGCVPDEVLKGHVVLLILPIYACLLKAPPFNMTYRDGIILTVTRTV